MTSPSETDQQRDGGIAEKIALGYLCKNGLVLIEKNFRCHGGEIDLIMKNSDGLVFAEVRFRARGTEDALYSISKGKRQRLRKATLVFLQQNPSLANLPIRFDVLAIGGSTMNPEIHWVADAFQDE